MDAARPLKHYGRCYGARTSRIIGSATALDGLGRHFGAQLYEAEVRHLVNEEWAQTADDILTRRTKHGLHLSADEKAAFSSWFNAEYAARAA